MKSLRTIAAICFQNLRKWQTDYRIWTIAVLVIIMVNIYVDDIRKIAVYLGTDVPIWIFPFLYSQYHTKVIYTLPVILIFCNAPFADQNQIFIYMRTGRVKWICGQILYIVFASAFYYIFLFIVTILCTMLYGNFNMEWGKTLQTISVTLVASDAGCPFVVISPIVLNCFTPFQAVWFTFLMSLCGAVLLGLIIFFCNLVSRTRFLGVLISSALVVLSVPADISIGYLVKFSPISWTTLDKIDVGGMTAYPSFTYCISVYLVLIAVLIAGILIFGRKRELLWTM